MKKLRGVINGILASVIFVSSFVSVSNAAALPATGDGSLENPYEISTCEELQSINQDMEANYVLVSDIDCAGSDEWNDGQGFEPIGDLNEVGPFSGTLDGRGHAISDIVIDRVNDEERFASGLFGAIVDGTVKNLDITGVVSGGLFTGGVVGVLYFNGSVINVNADQLVIGNVPDIDVGGVPFAGVGGIAGIVLANGVISRSSSAGPLAASMESDIYILAAGGLAGFMMDGGVIHDSYSTRDLYSLSPNQVTLGGIAGAAVQFDGSTDTAPSSIINTYATGSVHIEEGINIAGGLVGIVSFASISNSFSATTMLDGSEESQVGGLFGGVWDDFTLENNYFDVGLAEKSDCTFEGPIDGCTRINTMEAQDATYFFDASHQPLSNWDFDNLWIEHEDTYPTLSRAAIIDPVDPEDPEEQPSDDGDSTPSLPTGPIEKYPLYFSNNDTTQPEEIPVDTPEVVISPPSQPNTPTITKDSNTPTKSQGPDAYFWVYVSAVGGLGIAGVTYLVIRRLR